MKQSHNKLSDFKERVLFLTKQNRIRKYKDKHIEIELEPVYEREEKLKTPDGREVKSEEEQKKAKQYNDPSGIDIDW